RDSNDHYTVILAHFAARRSGDNSATARTLAHKLSDSWPVPVIRYLRGELDETGLLKLADDDDKRTEARCYLGLDLAIKGQKDEAHKHFRWVQENGNTDYLEYILAEAEIEFERRTPSKQLKR